MRASIHLRRLLPSPASAGEGSGVRAAAHAKLDTLARLADAATLTLALSRPSGRGNASASSAGSLLSRGGERRLLPLQPAELLGRAARHVSRETFARRKTSEFVRIDRLDVDRIEDGRGDVRIRQDSDVYRAPRRVGS